MTAATFKAKFGLNDKVHIDGDTSITATVIGLAFYGHGPQLQCAWFANGGHVEIWAAEFRLSQAGASKS